MKGRWLWGLVLIVSGAFAQPYATNGDPRLAELMAEAVRKYPAVEESLARYRAALQRIPQITSLPEPELSLEHSIRAPDSPMGDRETTVMISQTIPWFGKLDENGKVAAREADVERQRLETWKAEIVLRVKQAYYQIAYIDRAIAITEEDLGLLEHFEGLAQARYSQGVGLQQPAVKLQAEITRDHNQLYMLRQQRVDAEAALNNLLDRPPETPMSAVTFERPRAAVADLPALYKKAQRDRPELKATFLEIEKNEKRIQAARKEFWPDLTVGAGYMTIPSRPARDSMPAMDDTKAAIFSVGIELPIRRRKYNAAVLEASEDFVAARQQYRREENEVVSVIRSVAFRLQTLEQQAELFERALIPQADQALRSTEAAYSTGSLGVLELLDSERMLLDVRLGLANLEAEYMKALADMERAIGSPFPEEKP
jgi:outer membrane protein TolC